MSVSTTVPQLDTYLDSFTVFQKTAAGRELEWLKKLREDSFARFAEVGFPTTHDEDWRFTNVAPIARTTFKLADPAAQKLSFDDLAPYRIPEALCSLVFIDGYFVPELSPLGTLPKGVEVRSLAAALTSSPSALEPHFGRYLNTQRDAFAALNTAFANDGGYVYIKKGVVVEQPIHLIFVSTGGAYSHNVAPAQPYRCGERKPGGDRRRLCFARRWRGLLEHRDGIGCRGERSRVALHARARAHGCLQHLDAAHSAGDEAPMSLHTPSCWAADWFATTFIRC